MPHDRRPVPAPVRARLIAAKMLAAARGELGTAGTRTDLVPNALAIALERLEHDGLIRIVRTPEDALPYRFDAIYADRQTDVNQTFNDAFASLPTTNALPDLEPHLKHFGARSSLRETLAALPIVIDPATGAIVGATQQSLTRAVSRLRRQLAAVTLDNANVVYAQKELRSQFDAIVRVDDDGREYALFATREDAHRALDVVLEASRPSNTVLDRLAALHAAGFGLDAARTAGNYDLRFTDPLLRADTFRETIAPRLDRRQAESIMHAALAEQRERERSQRRDLMVTTVLRHGARIAQANPALAYDWLQPKRIADAEAERRYEAMTRGDEHLPEMRTERTIVRDGLASLTREQAIAFKAAVEAVVNERQTRTAAMSDHHFIARALANGLHLVANITTPLSEEQALRLVTHIAERSPSTYRDLARAVNEELRRERRALQWSFEDSTLGRSLKRTGSRQRERDRLFQDTRRGTAQARQQAVERVPLDARLRVINDISREALLEHQAMERNLEMRERLDEAKRDENRRSGAIPTAVFTSARDILQPRFIHERELDPLFLKREAARERVDGAMTRLARDAAYEEVRLLDDLLRDKYDSDLTNEAIGQAATFETEPAQWIYSTGRIGFLTSGGEYVRYDQLAAIAFPRGTSYLPDRGTIDVLAQAETALTFTRSDDIVTAISPENLDEAQLRISERHELLAESAVADARIAAQTDVAYDLTTTLATAQVRLEQLRRAEPTMQSPREAGASSAIRATTGPLLAIGTVWAAMASTDGTNRVVFHERRLVPEGAHVGDVIHMSYDASHSLTQAVFTGEVDRELAELDPSNFGGLSVEEQSVLRDLARDAAEREGVTLIAHKAPAQEQLVVATVLARTGNGIALRLPDNTATLVSTSRLKRLPEVGSEIFVRDTPNGILPFDGRRPPTPFERLPERAHDIAYERAALLALSHAVGKSVDRLRPLSQHDAQLAELAVLLPTNGDTYFGRSAADGAIEYVALPTFAARYGEHPLQRLEYESALQLADGSRIEEWQELAKAQASLPAEQRQELATLLTAGGSYAPTTAPLTRSALSRDDAGELTQPHEHAEASNLVANDLRKAINTGGAVFEFREGYVVGMTPFDGIERAVPIATISKANDFPDGRDLGFTVLGTVLDRHDAGIFYGVREIDHDVAVGFVSDTELGGPPPEAEFGDLIQLQLQGDHATVLDLVPMRDRDTTRTRDHEHTLPDHEHEHEQGQNE